MLVCRINVLIIGVAGYVNTIILQIYYRVWYWKTSAKPINIWWTDRVRDKNMVYSSGVPQLGLMLQQWRRIDSAKGRGQAVSTSPSTSRSLTPFIHLLFSPFLLIPSPPLLPLRSKSVGPGADPGVQAVSPQVTWSESRHIPSSSLPLLSAGPAVTPVAFTRWRYL